VITNGNSASRLLEEGRNKYSYPEAKKILDRFLEMHDFFEKFYSPIVDCIKLSKCNKETLDTLTATQCRHISGLGTSYKTISKLLSEDSSFRQALMERDNTKFNNALVFGSISDFPIPDSIIYLKTEVCAQQW